MENTSRGTKGAVSVIVSMGRNAFILRCLNEALSIPAAELTAGVNFSFVLT
jgi:hypothetical protein